MSKTITVRGVGHVTAKPDKIVIDMSQVFHNRSYDKAMNAASEGIDQITDALVKIGFERKAVKTTNFTVNTDYEKKEDNCGNYKRIFVGYSVSHDLTIEFPLDLTLLSDVLSAISGCSTHPELSISFAVYDVTAVKEELLRSLTANAEKTAKVLCDTAGVRRGNLISIEYNWNEINFYSSTSYEMDMRLGSKPMDIVPNDIDVTDTAVFTWEIL